MIGDVFWKWPGSENILGQLAFGHSFLDLLLQCENTYEPYINECI
jgi:hypothetical protein